MMGRYQPVQDQADFPDWMGLGGETEARPSPLTQAAAAEASCMQPSGSGQGALGSSRQPGF